MQGRQHRVQLSTTGSVRAGSGNGVETTKTRVKGKDGGKAGGGEFTLPCTGARTCPIVAKSKLWYGDEVTHHFNTYSL